MALAILPDGNIVFGAGIYLFILERDTLKTKQFIQGGDIFEGVL